MWMFTDIFHVQYLKHWANFWSLLHLNRSPTSCLKSTKNRLSDSYIKMKEAKIEPPVIRTAKTSLGFLQPLKDGVTVKGTLIVYVHIIISNDKSKTVVFLLARYDRGCLLFYLTSSLKRVWLVCNVLNYVLDRFLCKFDWLIVIL